MQTFEHLFPYIFTSLSRCLAPQHNQAKIVLYFVLKVLKVQINKSTGMHSRRMSTASRLSVLGVSAFWRVSAFWGWGGGSAFSVGSSTCPKALWDGKNPSLWTEWLTCVKHYLPATSFGDGKYYRSFGYQSNCYKVIVSLVGRSQKQASLIRYR